MINKNGGGELDMPLGLSMALSQNPALFTMFSSLTPEQRESLVNSAGKRNGDNGIAAGRSQRDIHRYD